MISQGRAFSALKQDTTMEGVAGCALWLLSDLGASTTGEIVHVDAGFHMIGMAEPEAGEGLGAVGDLMVPLGRHPGRPQRGRPGIP